jgi:pimeloyl-ACP methyl ester carboxylesterase
MPYSTSPTNPIYYDTTGSGPPLFLIHGVGSSGQMWHDLGYVDVLARHFTAIAVDLPGFGRNTTPLTAETFGLRGSADAVRDLMDELGIERAALLGYSWGGMTSLRFAAAYPERLTALVVGAANTARHGANHEAWVRTRPPLYQRLGPGLRRRALAVIARLTRSSNNEGWEDRLAMSGVSMNEAWRRYATDMEEFGRTQDAITAPTLFYQGERDQLFNVELTRQLADRLPDASLAAIPGIGHELNGRPDLVLPVVEPFLLRTAGLA